MAEDVQELFERFKKQVEEISSHAEEVSQVRFTASLKNGTGFNFRYDADQWETRHDPYKPLSVAGAVTDIISGGVSIALMILHVHEAGFVLCASTLLAYSVLDAVRLLMPGSMQRTQNALFSLCCAIRILFLCLFSLTRAQGSQAVVLSSLGLAALALVFLSMQTRGGKKASVIVASIIPWMTLLSGVHSARCSRASRRPKLASGTAFSVIALLLQSWL